MKLDKFINRPVLSTVISILIVILGAIGLATLPITQYPDIAPPTVSVRATYTGASASTVLNSVIAPLEEQINGVENMMYMTSNASNTGSGDISIYFKQGTDPDMAAVNVQNRVSMAQGLLPAEVTRIGVTTQKRQTSMLVVFSLYDETDTYTDAFIENYAKINLIPQVQRVQGVGDASVMGQDYSMRIWLRPDVMAQYKLIPNDVSTALAEQNIEAAPGQFGERSNQTFQYTIRYKGRLQQPEEFENIVIKSLPNGEVLRLNDIAEIQLDRLGYNFTNRVNGHKAVTCIVYQMAGTNATQTITDIQKLLDEASTTLPSGLKINVSMNANDFLFASIHEVLKTLIEAFILVFIVVYIFLQDLRSTLIPTIAIPVALIGTFFVLSLIGFSLNLLTLCALVLAIAIVVDDAIVVVEGVHAKLDQGYTSARLASIDAMNELGGAIVSITLVMMSVFIPVSFMGGTAGTFYRQFGLTMAIAIGLSALNALTLSPALCAVLLKPHTDHGDKKQTLVSRFHTSFNAAYDSILKRYKKRVLFFIQKKWLSMGLVVLSIVLLIFFMNTTPTGMVPNEDTGTLMGAVTLPPGTSQDRSEQILARVDSLIAADPAVASRTLISGFSFIGGQGPSYGSFIIKLKDWDERSMIQNSDVIVGSLYMRAQKIIKEAQVLFFAPPMIPGYSASTDIEVNMQDKTGGDLNKFFDVANNYTAALEARPEINSAKTTFNPNFPQYAIDIDAAKCKRAGISPSEVLSVLGGYCGGIYASNFNLFSKVYRIMIQADPKYRLDEKSLNNIFVRVNGEMAPISQFLSVKKTMGPEVTNRFNLFDAIACNVNPAPGYSSGQTMQAIEEVFAQTMPNRYNYEYGGISREEKETAGSNDTVFIYVFCIVLIFLILSCLYESFLVPMAVILSVPCGLMGSFLFAWLFGLENNIYLQTGVIMLIGLLAKTAILITEYATERRRKGMGIIEAAYSAAQVRFRPILMTVLTMIFGMLPLMFATGAGANGNSSLGTGVVGGMLIGTLALLFITPVFFIVFQYLQEKVRPPLHEEADAQVLAERQKSLEERSAFKSEKDEQ